MKTNLAFRYQLMLVLTQSYYRLKMRKSSKHKRAHCRTLTSSTSYEHLLRAHPILPVIFSKLFHLIILCRRVPAGFGCSYIVPLPKSKDSITKTMTCDDFRSIAISPVISTLFEYCFIEKFGEFLSTDSRQFGFCLLYTSPSPRD